MEMEKLDSKSLMIGDLVKNCFGKNERVEQILESSVMLDFNDTYSFDEIEPIPITEEILKKNGFELDEEASNDFGFECYIFPLGKGFFIEHHNEYRITDHQLMEFRYVHEFQQLLRLCKIDKEIEL